MSPPTHSKHSQAVVERDTVARAQRTHSGRRGRVRHVMRPCGGRDRVHVRPAPSARPTAAHRVSKSWIRLDPPLTPQWRSDISIVHGEPRTVLTLRHGANCSNVGELYGM